MGMGVVDAVGFERSGSESGSESRSDRRISFFRVLRTACVAWTNLTFAISSSMLRISIALLWRLVSSFRCSVCLCCSLVSLSSSSVGGVVGGYSRRLSVSNSVPRFELAELAELSDDVSHLSVSVSGVGDSAGGGVVGGVVVGDTRSTVTCLGFSCLMWSRVCGCGRSWLYLSLGRVYPFCLCA